MYKLTIPTMILLASASYGQSPYDPAQNEESSNDSKPSYSNRGRHNFDDTTVAGQIWLPDKGLMVTPMPKESWKKATEEDKLFSPEGRLDNRRTLPYDLEDAGYCVTLKVQQNYEDTDEKGDPGTFTWVKDAGSSSYWNVDAAIRMDIWLDKIYDPRGLEASLALGYDINKSDKPGQEIDQQSFHLSVPFVPNDLFGWLPFLADEADQVFQGDFSYTRDEVADDDGFDFETDWEPVFVFPWENYGSASSASSAIGNATKGLWVGVRCGTDGIPLDPRKAPARFFYHIDPNVGVSYGDKYSLGSPVSNIATELTGTYSLGLEIGGPVFFGRDGNSRNGILVTLDYAIKGGTSLTSDGDFTYQQAGLHFKPAQAENPITLDLVYKNGENGFAQAKVEQFTIGLGVKF